jgi:hypothetical protein
VLGDEDPEDAAEETEGSLGMRVLRLLALVLAAVVVWRDVGRGESQVTLSDLEKPQAPIQPADWKTMPDVIGIHLHAPLEDAVALLKKQYPKAVNFQLWPVNPLGDGIPPARQKTITGGITVQQSGVGDEVRVNVTQPPNVPVVWYVWRMAQMQRVNRGTLLASLREKYGKETYAPARGMNGEPAKNDLQVAEIWWLFDEQGKRIPPPQSGFNTVGTCRAPGPVGVALNAEFIRNSASQSGGTWCESSYVGVHANIQSFGDLQIIDTMTVELTSIPLALRAAKITADFQRTAAERFRQQEIERSKQAKPKL